jgi:hypothetical protein
MPKQLFAKSSLVYREPGCDGWGMFPFEKYNEKP